MVVFTSPQLTAYNPDLIAVTKQEGKYGIH